ncbi:MAG: autoinducer binding domain-containing protein [Pseudomonadota bacterium]
MGVARAFDLEHFAYLSLPSPSAAKPRLISNYPRQWTSHYLCNRYDKVDPVITHAQSGEHPFRWGFNGRLDTISRKFSSLER